MKNSSRFGWYVLFFCTILLFVLNLSLQLLVLNVLIIGLASIIYKYGQPSMFQAYEERRQRQLDKANVIKEAAGEILHSGELFKK